jgi:hypothetical protein
VEDAIRVLTLTAPDANSLYPLPSLDRSKQAKALPHRMIRTRAPPPEAGQAGSLGRQRPNASTDWPRRMDWAASSAGQATFRRSRSTITVLFNNLFSLQFEFSLNL